MLLLFDRYCLRLNVLLFAADCFSVARQALCEMGATVGPVDTAKFALDLEGLWTKFNSLDPEAMLAASGGATSDTR